MRHGKRNWAAVVFAAVCAVVLGSLGTVAYLDCRVADPQEVLLFGADKWTPGSYGMVRVVVRNGKTQLPIGDAEVHATLGISDAKASTGPDGSATMRLPAPETGGVLKIEVSSPFGTDRLERDIAVERSWRVLVSTDKPLYQPGQTIHLRSQVVDHLSLKPVEADLVLEVEDPNGNRVFKKSLRTSPFGIASADFTLADEVNLGAYKIRASVGQTRSERTVDVKRYVLPTFKVGLRLHRGYYEPGDLFRADLEARYLFGKPVAGSPVQVVLRRWTGTGFEPFAELAARTDGEGKASVETRLPDRFLGTEHENLGDAVMRVEATVTDGAGHSEQAAKSATVSRQALRVQIFPEAGRYVDSVDQTMHILVSYPDGTPAAAKVSLQDSAASAETDATGVAVLPMPQSHFVVVAMDRAGNKGESRTHYAHEFWQDWRSQNFLLRSDRITYPAGGRARLTLISGTDGPVYIDLVKSGQTLLTRSVQVVKGKGELFVDLPPDLAGTVWFTGYRIRSDGFLLRGSRLAVIERSEELRIRAVATKEEYRPGEEIDLSFDVTDQHGNPAPSALGLSVVDEAVFALQEARPGSERSSFERDPEVKGLAPHLVAAAVQPVIQPMASSLYSTKSSEVYRTARDAKEFLFGAFLVSLGLGILASFVWAIYRATKGSWSGFVTGCLFLGFLLLLFAISIPGLLSSQRASNERSAAYRAREAELARQAAAAAAGTAAPRIREHFPETLYWNPELITDEKGRAQVKIPGADSITTWRMSMSAVTRSGKFGAGDRPLRVFQPFFVDLDLPVALTQGDEVWLPVAVYNYQKEGQTVALTLEADEGFEIADERTKSVSVGPGDVTSVRFHLRARRFGRHALLVKAVGTSFSDAVRRWIDVHPDGKEVAVSVGDRLKSDSRATVRIPESSLEGATRLWVRIFPSTFSEIVTGLEGLIRMPYG